MEPEVQFGITFFGDAEVTKGADEESASTDENKEQE